MENIQTIQKPRIVLLYRASTKKQTDSENDIPLQRNILTQWAEQKGYEFVKEFVEGGVSGFKVSASKRDAIVEIKAMAQRKEFDILGIYMSDRLGRIAEETPLIVSYLNERNIKVISYNEGEINSSTHTDKLMTYIRYWQAEGESLKTSLRVADSIKEMVKQGRWPGGTISLGYKFVSRGTLNYKGRPIFDIEINPEEAEIVKTVFRLYTKEHYGTRYVAKYLNEREYKRINGSMFNSSYIVNILTNKIYIGIYELGKTKARQNRIAKEEIIESPVVPEFVIIDKETFDKAQVILAKNKSRPKTYQRKTVYGQLLNGLLFCGECGRKFTSHSYKNRVTRKDGSLYYHKGSCYKCMSYYYPTARKDMCTQSPYNTLALEQQVIQDAKEFILSIDKDKLLTNYKTQSQEQLSLTTKNLKRLETDISKIDKELIKLKSEVIKSLTGESSFSQDLLSTLLKDKEIERNLLIPKQEQLQQEISQMQQSIDTQSQISEDLDNWSTRFDSQTKEGKKAMLLNIIEKITLNNNKVEIQYKIQFVQDKITQTVYSQDNELKHSLPTTLQDNDSNLAQNSIPYSQPPSFFTPMCVNGSILAKLRDLMG